MGYRASVVHPEHGSEYVRWTETRVLKLVMDIDRV